MNYYTSQIISYKNNETQKLKKFYQFNKFIAPEVTVADMWLLLHRKTDNTA